MFSQSCDYSAHVKLQIQAPGLLPFCDSLKEFLVVLVILLQALGLTLMQIEELLSEVICLKRTKTQ